MSALLAECRCSCTGRTTLHHNSSAKLPSRNVSRHRRRRAHISATIDDRSNGQMTPSQPAVPEGVLDPEAYLAYMQEYKDLKDLLLNRTRQTAAALALYLLLAATGEDALCALIGGGFSYVYLLWLFHDVDSYKADDVIPMVEAQKIDVPIASTIAKVLAGYQQALRPRLLVPTLLAAGTAAVSLKAGPLPLVYDGCLLAGFLSYKVALITRVFEELSPKFGEEPRKKPSVVPVDDELDFYGRPKAKVALPTDVIPEEDREKVLEAAKKLEERGSRSSSS